MPTSKLCDACGEIVAQAHNCRPHFKSYAEASRRAGMVRRHIQRYGLECPGWGEREAHPVTLPNILVADHVEAVGAGGSESGRLMVICRECNTQKKVG